MNNHGTDGLEKKTGGLLFIITCMLIALPMGTGHFFGSEGDWYSQHVGIAESIRQAMLESHSWLPNYIHLGGGSSVYDYAYYGVLRPDVLISCLLPNVEMKYVIAGYAVFGMISSVWLLFVWLKRKGITGWPAFFGAVIFACSTCFYHAHHQIMFVNYMPFLILAFMGVDRIAAGGKSGFLLTVSLFLIYLHSFYYAVSCLFVVGIYALHMVYKERKKWGQAEGLSEDGRADFLRIHKKYILCFGRLLSAVILSIGMAMVLLLPVGLDILSTSKDAGSYAGKALHLVNWRLSGLLYNPYGCGMTILTLYCLLVSLRSRKKHFLSAAALVSMLVPAVSLVLNGFLYARVKILIPFTPLLALVTADTLRDFWEGKERHSAAAFLLSMVPAFLSSWRPLIIIDSAFVLIWILLQRRKGFKKEWRTAVFGLALAMPLLVSIGVNASDSYFRPLLRRLGIPLNGGYIAEGDQRQERFTKAEIGSVVTNGQYRFDSVSDSLENCNLTIDGQIKRTSMYSSISNAGYAQFYYDTMANAIPGNNRVALLPGKNPFLNYFLGVRYVLADSRNIPEGYEVRLAKDGYVLAERENVLPVCYGTTDLVSRSDYDRLSFPENLEVLCRYAVVERAEGRGNANGFATHFKEIDITKLVGVIGKRCLLKLNGRQDAVLLPLTEHLQNKILVLRFHVNRRDKEAVEITINGVKNKLSAVTAPYPNGNDTFTYIFESGEDLGCLELAASGGDYGIEDIECYVLDNQYMEHKNVTEVRLSDSSDVFAGEIDMSRSGYFVTSFPYREGYQVIVDGKAVEPQVVNTTFLGFPITEGAHRIEIRYTAPGYRIGLVISLSAFALCFTAFVLNPYRINHRSSDYLHKLAGNSKVIQY